MNRKENTYNYDLVVIHKALDEYFKGQGVKSLKTIAKKYNLSCSTLSRMAYYRKREYKGV